MTDREKLVELIDEVAEGTIFVSAGEQRVSINSDDIADYLLANGVTVQQWISVEERLPEKYVDVLGKSGKLIWVVSFDGMQWEDNYGYYHKIEEFPCWMPLPEAPKEG